MRLLGMECDNILLHTWNSWIFGESQGLNLNIFHCDDHINKPKWILLITCVVTLATEISLATSGRKNQFVLVVSSYQIWPP